MNDLAEFMTCHPTASPRKGKRQKDGRSLTIALAGNANVGESVIFNQLTGSNQIIGNWPGKRLQSGMVRKSRHG
jgi:GTP-binding protein EngB required for normal cell division